MTDDFTAQASAPASDWTPAANPSTVFVSADSALEAAEEVGYGEEGYGEGGYDAPATPATTPASTNWTVYTAK